MFGELVRRFNTHPIGEVWEELTFDAESAGGETPEKLEAWGVQDYRLQMLVNFMSLLKKLFSLDSNPDELNEALLVDTLAKSAVTAVGGSDVGSIQAADGIGASDMVDLSVRVGNLKNNGRQDCGKIAVAFDNQLRETMKFAQAGETKNYWSYKASVKSNVREEIHGKRFLELWPSSKAISVRVGKFLAEEELEIFLKHLRKEAGSQNVAPLKKYGQPYAVKKIDNEGKAKKIAEIIGKAYSGDLIDLPDSTSTQKDVQDELLVEPEDLSNHNGAES